MHEHMVLGLVALMGLATIGQWIAHALRIPSIILLLAVGLCLGPIAGWLDPDELLGSLLFPFVSLGAALILFEGGLSARLSDLRQASSPLLRLVTLGILIAWTLTSLAAWYLLNLSPALSTLLGAILVVTGPTVIGPILRHARPTKSVARVLKFEGILNDPLGALLAALVFQVIFVERERSALSMAAGAVLEAIGASTGIGLLSAGFYVLVRKKNWLPESLENAVLLSLVLASYALSGAIFPESGLIAVTVMGIALASQSKVTVDTNLVFFEHVRTMLLAVLFVTLTARIEREQLLSLSIGTVLFVSTLILVIRPIVVLASTWRTDLTLRERLFISFVAPRGIVAAAVASVFALRLGKDAESLLPVTFVSIIVCVVGYGLLASPLASLLKLRRAEPIGVLIVGANHLATLIAEALQKEEIPVLMVDDDRRKVTHARFLGLQAAHGKLLSDRVLNRLDLDEMGQLLALTPNDDVNTLAVARFRPLFGRENVHQVSGEFEERERSERSERYARELRGVSFAPEHSFGVLYARAKQATAKVTRLTSEFTFEDYQKHHGSNALPLLILDEKGRMHVFDSQKTPPDPGDRILSLITSRPQHRPVPSNADQAPAA